MKVTDPMKTRIINAKNVSGLSVPEIADKYKITTRRVYQILSEGEDEMYGRVKAKKEGVQRISRKEIMHSPCIMGRKFHGHAVKDEYKCVNYYDGFFKRYEGEKDKRFCSVECFENFKKGDSIYSVQKNREGIDLHQWESFRKGMIKQQTPFFESREDDFNWIEVESVAEKVDTTPAIVKVDINKDAVEGCDLIEE